MFGLFYAILKDKREPEQIPKLESETISLCKPDGTYFLRVKKNEKAITACKGANGFITVEGTTVQDPRTVDGHMKIVNRMISVLVEIQDYPEFNKTSPFSFPLHQPQVKIRSQKQNRNHITNL
jgi:hypothetical protein